jgi:hypothetical protein
MIERIYSMEKGEMMDRIKKAEVIDIHIKQTEEEMMDRI